MFYVHIVSNHSNQMFVYAFCGSLIIPIMFTHACSNQPYAFSLSAPLY